MRTLAILAIASVSLFVTASADYPTEVQWQKREANWSRYVSDTKHVEVRLWDNSRCDYVSATHAIEIDWATSSKVFEAIGQAEYYSIVLDLKPGIILLVKETERESSRKYIYRCQTVCTKLNIKLWIEIVKEE